MDKVEVFARITSATVFCAAFGLYAHHDYLHWNQAGRSAFLQHQADRFNISFAHPHSTPVVLASFLILLLPVAASYELLAWLIGKLLHTMSNTRHRPKAIGHI